MEFSDLRMMLSTKLPSDACAHLMQVFDYMKFDEKIYTEICNKYPLQKLNGGCELIKGSLFYESLKNKNMLNNCFNFKQSCSLLLNNS